MTRREPQFNVRMPADLKDAITEQAAKNKRSINAEIVAAIEFSLAAQRGQVKSQGDNVEIILSEEQSERLSKVIDNLKSISELEGQLKEIVNKFSELPRP
ncbi:Arc family DNA-binding protein [Aeromonas veronii]|uniref:Arc family DNA-binding protein n=1 Tax=Aeromonas veronii TaxID=654 RepID=UPI0018F15216|nr:Arc family DNA-binding protein [Aeromonas veronii]MBJ7582972.1 Arc family DNA-binding protein [Aeromonas veronii]